MNSEQKSESKSEQKKENRPHTIGYRLTEEDYQEAETWAELEGISVHEWCRRAAMARLKDGRGMSLETRLLYEEIARLRFITGQCFKLLASDELDAETWEKVKTMADEKGAEIADNLLKRAVESGGSNGQSAGKQHG